MLRPAIGESPFNYKKIVGKKLKSSKKNGNLLKITDFQ